MTQMKDNDINATPTAASSVDAKPDASDPSHTLDPSTTPDTPQPPAEPDANALDSIGRAITQPLRDAAEPEEARQTPDGQPARTRDEKDAR